MEIEFRTKKMAKACSSEEAMRKDWGSQMAKKLMQRLADLEAAKTLEDVRHLPGRCHELTGDRKGQLALDLVHPQRLIFAPAHDPVPTRHDGGLDWTQVTAVRIMEVKDYH